MTPIQWVRSSIASDKSAGYCLALMLAAVAAATAVRWALRDFSPQLIFVTYYPAVLICTLFTSWRYGAACAALSGVIGIIMFADHSAAGQPEVVLLANFVLFLASCVLIMATAETLRRTVRELEQANSTALALNSELQHRVRNTLTVVQALASLTAETCEPGGFLAAFNGRLQALADANELLGRNAVETTSLSALIKQACGPFSCSENILKSGPACQLPRESCVPLVLALHELCTNAAKYGALSTPEGKVSISWGYRGELQRVEILWEESGGPLVEKPTRKGLGSALLSPQTGIAEVELNFDAGGVRCMLSIDGAEPLAAYSRQEASVSPRAVPSMR